MKQELEDFEAELLSIKELKDHLRRIKRNFKLMTITFLVVLVTLILLTIII